MFIYIGETEKIFRTFSCVDAASEQSKTWGRRALQLKKGWPRGRDCFLITRAPGPLRDNYSVSSLVRVKATFKLLLFIMLSCLPLRCARGLRVSLSLFLSITID